MKLIISVTSIRFRMLKNFIVYQLKQTPLLSSLLLIVPVIVYVAMEFFLPRDMKTYTINPNLKELWSSYQVLFHQLLYFTSILAAPSYLFLSQCSRKSYQHYKHRTLSYKTMTLANIVMLFIMVDVGIAIIFGMILFHTQSTLASSITMITMIIVSCDIILYLLYVASQMLSNFFVGIAKRMSVMFLEFLATTFLSLLVLLATKYISFSTVMRIPSIAIVVILVLLVLFTSYGYRSIHINEKYVNQTKQKEESVLMFSGNITILKNYLLMMFGARKIYKEYLFTILVMLLFIMFSNRAFLKEEAIFQLLIPIFLVSNGIIYSNKQWYALRSKNVLTQMLALDACVSTVVLCLLCGISSFVFQIQNDTIPVGVTYLFLVVFQSQAKLEYGEDSKTTIVFVLTYAIMGFLGFYLVTWLLSFM